LSSAQHQKDSTSTLGLGHHYRLLYPYVSYTNYLFYHTNGKYDFPTQLSSHSSRLHSSLFHLTHLLDYTLLSLNVMSAQRTAKILIIGGGCFGVSSAYHLLKRGFTNVTILDRSPTLPAPDAASNDINRSPYRSFSILGCCNSNLLLLQVVRSSYADRYYCDLAREAIGQWKDKEKWEDSYHE